MRTYKLTVILSAAFALGIGAATQGAVVAQFDFDAAPTNGGKTFTDISGNGHDVTFYSAITTSMDNYFNNPNSRSIDPSSGTYGYGNLAGIGTMNFKTSGNQLTLEGWVRPTAYGGTLIDLRGTSGGTTEYLEVGYDSSGIPWARVGTSSSTISGTTAIPLNDWTHLAAEYKDGYLSLYVNAAYIGRTSVGLALADTITSAYIGGTAKGTVNGLIDDIRISDTALDPSQLGYYGSFTSVPEPGAAALLGLGALLALRRKRTRA